MSAQLRGLDRGNSLGCARHPVCDLPNRRRSQRVTLNELAMIAGNFLFQAQPGWADLRFHDHLARWSDCAQWMMVIITCIICA
jgi:hypothetical protein